MAMGTQSTNTSTWITLTVTRHWENIYKTKQVNEVGWYQPVPLTSLAISERNSIFLLLPKLLTLVVAIVSSLIILLDMGYEDITVLDISETAITRAKERLGEKAENIKWIIADAARF